MGRVEHEWIRRFERSCKVLVGLGAASILLVAGGARAGARRIDPQQFILRAALVDPASTASVVFGRAVSVSADGRTAVVTEATGANLVTQKGVVFTRTGAGWVKTADLVPSDPTGSSFFAYAVAVSGDGNTVVLGAITVNQDAGAAYVFHRSATGWSQEAKLVASDGAPMDSLGESVALGFNGSTALVGAPGKASGAGALYVFQRSPAGWAQRQELLASDGVASAGFGASSALSFDGGTALVGAPNRGAAYVFLRGTSGWSESAILGEQYGGGFGYKVALSADGRTALVGAPARATYPSVYPSSAFVFTGGGSTWSEQARLQPGVSTSGFGQSVALGAAGNAALVGAPGTNGSVGEAFFFLRNGSTWSQPTALTSPGQGPGRFGNSVALDSAGDQGVILPWVASSFGVPGWVFGLQPTTTVLSASAWSALLGAKVTYTANVSPVPGDGTVSFWAGGAPLAGCLLSPVDPTTGAATCTTVYSSIGRFPVSAAYSGGSAQASSSSAISRQTVGVGIHIQSPTAGSLVSPFVNLLVRFSLSSGTGPLPSAQDQLISNACAARVSIPGGASGVCTTYDSATGSFVASLAPASTTSGALTISVSVYAAGGAPVSNASVVVGRWGTGGFP